LEDARGDAGRIGIPRQRRDRGRPGKAAELGVAHKRIIGLQTGYGDLLEPDGIDPSDRAALAQIRVAVRFAAAEVGVAADDGAYAQYSRSARRRGFAGKSCIQPSHIDGCSLFERTK
jgi:citrate lyase subunit beta/citryl-CoA lyase